MKKLLLITSILLASLNAYTQATQEISKSNIGISIGKNLTYPVGTYGDRWRDNAGITAKRLGFAAALHYQFSIGKNWELRTEFMYQRKRGYFKDDYDYFSNTTYYFISDNIKLSIPILVRFNIHRFFIELGPYIGYDYGITHYKSNSIGSRLTRTGKYRHDFDIMEYFYKGACLGAGYLILNKEKFSVSINLRNDQEITIEKKFLWKHPYNTTSLLFGCNYKL